MNLEALPKYYSPKSPKLSDDAPATGSGGLTITDVMAAQGMVQSKAPLGFALFLAKVGVQDPQFAIEGLLNYAMAWSVQSNRYFWPATLTLPESAVPDPFW